MMRFRWIKEKEIAIRNGDEEASDEIKALLNSGHELECVATYLSQTCKEWKTIIYPYILEKSAYLLMDLLESIPYTLFGYTAQM